MSKDCKSFISLLTHNFAESPIFIKEFDVGGAEIYYFEFKLFLIL